MSFLSIRSTFYWPRDYWRETNLSDRNFVMAAHNIENPLMHLYHVNLLILSHIVAYIDNTYIHFEFQLIFSRSLLNVFTQSIDWRKPLVWCIDCSWHSKSWDECVLSFTRCAGTPNLYKDRQSMMWYKKLNKSRKIVFIILPKNRNREAKRGDQ